MKKVFLITLMFSFMLGAKAMAENTNVMAPPPTTWDGSAWDNGVPDTTTTTVIIAGDYNTSVSGNLHGSNITINPGVTVTMSSELDSILAHNSLDNQGTINKFCASTITIVVGAAITGNPVNIFYPTINPPTLPDGMVGTNYNEVFYSPELSSSVWSYSGGPIPDGLTFTGGILSGTPTTVNSYSFDVTLDAPGGGCITIRGYTVNINPVVAVPTSTTWNGGGWDNGTPTLSIDAVIAADYDVSTWGNIQANNISVNSGVTVSLTVAVNSISAQGNLDNQGTINQACVSDVSFGSLTGIPINVVPPSIFPSVVSDGVNGHSYGSSTFSTDQLTTTSWLVSSGTLPPGLMFPSSGILSGTPTAVGFYSFTIDVTGDKGCSASGNYSINVAPPASTVWNGTSWSKGAPDSQTDATIAGNYDLTTWGDITAYNLTVNNSVTVSYSGKPSDQIFLYGDLVNNGTINRNCQQSLQVNGTTSGLGSINITNPVISPSTLPDGAYSVFYNQSFSTDIFLTEPIWSISSGTLPPGININSIGGFLSGTPTTPGTYNFSVHVNYFTCNTIQNYTVNITGPTTWNGIGWSGGVPTASTDAIIAGNYNTAVNGNITSKNLTINSGVILTIPVNTTVTANGSLDNQGTINRDCMATFTYFGVTNFGTYNYIYPQIGTALPGGVIGHAYSSNLTVTQVASPIWNITNGTLPPGITLTGGTLNGTPTTTGGYTFDIKMTTSLGTCSTTATLVMLVTSLPDPNLTLSNVSSYTYGEPPIKVKAYTASKAPITYSIVPSNPCAAIDASTGLVTISCIGTTSSITIQAIQPTNATFSGDTSTSTITLNKAIPTIVVDNVGILLSDTSAKVSYTSNSDGTPSYLQTEGTEVATVQPNGKIICIKEGKLSAVLTLAASTNYVSISEEIDLEVFANLQAPKAYPDSVNIIVGQDTTFNILANDTGYTGKIDPEFTDIDMENDGIQAKYYNPAGGTFLLDAKGNLTFKPFTGVIGKVKLSYTVTDSRGQTSLPTTVTINVIQPGAAPVLKATELFTPNGDGLNDAFVIGYINHDKTNYLKLYDRSGYEVYSENDYKNNWSGRLTNGKNIDEGIYYFIFSENNGEREAKGIIEIKR